MKHLPMIRWIAAVAAAAVWVGLGVSVFAADPADRAFEQAKQALDKGREKGISPITDAAASLGG